MNKNHTEIFSRIGKNLKKIRKEKGLTQEEVSKKIPKMDRSKLSDIENGKEDFVFSKLLNICEALNIEVEETFQKELKIDN